MGFTMLYLESFLLLNSVSQESSLVKEAYSLLAVVSLQKKGGDIITMTLVYLLFISLIFVIFVEEFRWDTKTIAQKIICCKAKEILLFRCKMSRMSYPASDRFLCLNTQSPAWYAGLGGCGNFRRWGLAGGGRVRPWSLCRSSFLFPACASGSSGMEVNRCHILYCYAVALPANACPNIMDCILESLE